MSGSGVDRLPSWKFGPPCGWLILIVLAGALACADRDAIEHKRPPNIVIVVADDIGVAWLAGSIYKVGLLMTGKRPTLPELLRWVREA